MTQRLPRRPRDPRLVPRFAIAAVLAVAVAGCGIPDNGPSPAAYRLPWAAGSDERVLQGAFATDPVGSACTSGCGTHRDDGMHFALDFDMAEGTPVLAARGGAVGLAQGSWSPSHCGGLTPIVDPPPGYLVNGLMGNQANFVRIDHGDGTSALYLHLRDVAPAVLQKAKSGGSVVQGELLGHSGRTGLTQCRPHLHFQVENTVPADWFTSSVPVSFADAAVARDASDGVPVEGRSYDSDNAVATAAG